MKTAASHVHVLVLGHILVAFLVCSPAVIAQIPFGTTDAYTNTPASTSTFTFNLQPEEIQPKKPGIALARAIGHTVIPAGLGYLMAHSAGFDDPAFTVGGLLYAYGVFIGPSMGNLYARDPLRGWGGVGMRLVSIFFIDMGEKDRAFRNRMGFGLLAGSALYNIASAPASVRKYNRELELEYSLQMQPVPGSVQTAPVLTARINF